MKRNLFIMGLLVSGLCITATSCSDDDNEAKSSDLTEEEAQNLDYNSSNANAWGNYAVNVAKLLNQDSQTLYDEWNNGYAAAFKSHTPSSGYTSAKACVEQIIDGCIDIADEVGNAKIGEPRDFWDKGQRNKAVYAVESWYSWHSRDDYKNNILSIANSVLGARIEGAPSKFDYKGLMSNDNTTASIMVATMKNSNMRTASIAVWQNICAAWDAIDAIPQPLRNNIGSSEVTDAIDACNKLVDALKDIKASIDESMTEEEAQSIVNQYVDEVVMPTYKALADEGKALLSSIEALQRSPTNAAFETACDKWLDARKPWETSEAFLFGPVDELGLDPNMDSWPLDAIGIANLLTSQKWSQMEWREGQDDNAIEAAQALRGFHTLEYLLFKDGQPRTVK